MKLIQIFLFMFKLLIVSKSTNLYIEDIKSSKIETRIAGKYQTLEISSLYSTPDGLIIEMGKDSFEFLTGDKNGYKLPITVYNLQMNTYYIEYDNILLVENLVNQLYITFASGLASEMISHIPFDMTHSIIIEFNNHTDDFVLVLYARFIIRLINTNIQDYIENINKINEKILLIANRNGHIKKIVCETLIRNSEFPTKDEVKELANKLNILLNAKISQIAQDSFPKVQSPFLQQNNFQPNIPHEHPNERFNISYRPPPHPQPPNMEPSQFKNPITHGLRSPAPYIQPIPNNQYGQQIPHVQPNPPMIHHNNSYIKQNPYGQHYVDQSPYRQEYVDQRPYGQPISNVQPQYRLPTAQPISNVHQNHNGIQTTPNVLPSNIPFGQPLPHVQPYYPNYYPQLQFPNFCVYPRTLKNIRNEI
jgi:hypothetical protein